MMLTALDAWRLIENNTDKTFTFPLYDVLSNNTTTAPKIPTLVPNSSTVWLVDKGQVVPQSHKALSNFLRELWDDIAEMSMNGEVVAHRESYGKPMQAVKSELFEQDAYDKLIEDDILAEKSGRELIAHDLTEAGAAAMMRGFIHSWEGD